MWNTTTEPVARPAIRNLGSRECQFTKEKFKSKLLLLVVRERQTPDAGVTGGEGVEQREVECPPDLSKDIVRIMQYIVAWNVITLHLDNSLVSARHHVFPVSGDQHTLKCQCGSGVGIDQKEEQVPLEKNIILFIKIYSSIHFFSPPLQITAWYYPHPPTCTLSECSSLRSFFPLMVKTATWWLG